MRGVVALFAGQDAAKDRVAMHAVLWNCGVDNFQSKDYETSAELFEKSMLYIPYSICQKLKYKKESQCDAWVLDTAQKPYVWQKLNSEGDRPSARMYATASGRSDGMFLLCSGRDSVMECFVGCISRIWNETWLADFL